MTKTWKTAFFLLGGLLAATQTQATSTLSGTVDGAQLLPQPPAAGSSEMKADEIFYEAGLAIRDSVRGRRAGRDAELVPLKAFEEHYGKLVNRDLSPEGAPKTHLALQAAMGPLIQSMKSAKKVFLRPRPFASHVEDETCRPDLKSSLNPRLSYPSGHSARAWCFAMVLSSLIPEKTEVIMHEALQNSESRWICGAHWMSDTKAGRVLASAVFAKLVSDPAFIALLNDAREELAR